MALLSELILRDEPLKTAAEAVYPYSPKLEKKYRFVSRYGDEVLLHRVSPDKSTIMLPRALCPVGLEDCRALGEEVDFPSQPVPRPHQEKPFKQTIDFLKAGMSGQVCAYTGFGKTVLGYAAAYAIGRKTLVITTKDDIYRQWIDGACGNKTVSNPDGINFLGLTPNEVGEIRGDKCEVIGTKFVVAMIHSLSKDGKYPDWIGDDFGLVIFDECHRVPADQFSSVATMFPAKLRLGLSATNERKDGKDLLVQAHVGPVRVKTDFELMVPKVLRFKSEWQCPRVIRTSKKTGEKKVVRMPHEPGRTAQMEKIIAADPVRNTLIGELAKEAHRKGRTTVIFSTQHDHLNAIRRVLVNHQGVPGKEIGFYIGATTKAELERRERDKVRPILLTTFAMMSEGTSLDWLDTAILAMPRSNVTQPAGRIRREFEDKLPPVIMDIVDSDSPVFAGYAAARLEWYQRIGAEVKDIG